MVRSLSGVFATGAGMHALWSAEAFPEVIDYDSWEERFLEEKALKKCIKAGSFVPINIGSDGVVGIELRVGDGKKPAVLSAREKKYLVVASDAYLFRSAGSVSVSGLEFIQGQKPDRQVKKLVLPQADYAATVQLIGWGDEPGMKDSRGNPKKGALPDFVVLLNPASAKTGKFRTELMTFPRPK